MAGKPSGDENLRSGEVVSRRLFPGVGCFGEVVSRGNSRVVGGFVGAISYTTKLPFSGAGDGKFERSGGRLFPGGSCRNYFPGAVRF